MAQRDPADAAAGTSSTSDKSHTKSSLLEESSTTDDCMSNLDEDSDTHSTQSRRDSLEPVRGTVQVMPSASDEARTERAASDQPSAEAALAGREYGGESGHKRNLPEEVRGQATTLRKACDLCTKVSVQSGELLVFKLHPFRVP